MKGNIIGIIVGVILTLLVNQLSYSFKVYKKLKQLYKLLKPFERQAFSERISHNLFTILKITDEKKNPEYQKLPDKFDILTDSIFKDMQQMKKQMDQLSYYYKAVMKEPEFSYLTINTKEEKVIVYAELGRTAQEYIIIKLPIEERIVFLTKMINDHVNQLIKLFDSISRSSSNAIELQNLKNEIKAITNKIDEYMKKDLKQDLNEIGEYVKDTYKLISDNSGCIVKLLLELF